jgi:hypothetical protein
MKLLLKGGDSSMVQNIDVNLMTVVIATVVNIGLGFAWYSKSLFGKAWMRELGLTDATLESMKSSMGKVYALMTLASLVMAYVLAHVVVVFAASTVMDGITAGFWMWLGFIATTSLNPVLWEKKSWTLYGINAGYYLVSLALMGVILTLWQ